mgnify:CR=1 FL=1
MPDYAKLILLCVIILIGIANVVVQFGFMSGVITP